MSLNSTTNSLAQALANACRKAEQMLRAYATGAAHPGTDGPNYTTSEAEAQVQAVIVAAQACGIPPSATVAYITHNTDLVVPVTGTYATKIKATVVAGAITGFVLS